jgi:hypothetical protein
MNLRALLLALCFATVAKSAEAGPARPPFIGPEAASKRASAFLREHGFDHSRYYISMIVWSNAPEAARDSWMVRWMARDSNQHPKEYKVVVTRSGFVTRALSID